MCISQKRGGVLGSHNIRKRNNAWFRENKSCTTVSDTQEGERYTIIYRVNRMLQTVYRKFLENCKTAYKINAERYKIRVDKRTATCFRHSQRKADDSTCVKISRLHTRIYINDGRIRLRDRRNLITSRCKLGLTDRLRKPNSLTSRAKLQHNWERIISNSMGNEILSTVPIWN